MAEVLLMGEIALGRINRAVERGLGLSLTGDVKVYGGGGFLDELAYVYPSCYLTMVEEIKNGVLKKPDFAFYDEKRECFHLMRVYCKNGFLSFWEARIVHVGVPKRWEIDFFGKTKNENRLGYVRIQ